jgi:hypothetical protein
MKSVQSVLALACGLGLAMVVQASPPHSATSAPAQRWTPDAPLRESMRRARAAVDEMHLYEMGHMSASTAMEQADAVEQAVAYMFARCKLAPEPDAALHGILVPLLSAAQAMKADPTNIKAVADMRAAIAHYPQYFNDPGWEQPTPAPHAAHDEP